ncbi:MAG: sulfatase [Thermoanaerobaculia bacterium]
MAPPVRALAALLLALGCRGALDGADTTIRLVQRGDEVAVRWPPRARPPQGLKPSAIGTLPPPAQVVDVVMFAGESDSDSRAALLVAPGARYRFFVRVPGPASLRLGLAYIIDPASTGRPIRYRVRLEPVSGGDPTVLLAEELRTAADGVWQDRKVSLAPWSGRDVVLELAAEPASREAAGPAVWPAYAVPEIVPSGLDEEGLDVILVSLDTLRADHLGCYGYERPTSPFLDGVAARGFRFAAAVSQSPWTRPSHRALFSGQYPLSRGSEVAEPLALSLWRAGYRTGAITGGGQVSYRFGFHHGFETYRVSDWVRSPEVVTDWLDEAPGRKAFLFLHTFEIHDPYDDPTFVEGLPPGRIRPGFGQRNWWGLRRVTDEEQAYVEALYDGDIRFVDQALRRLFTALEQRGILERAIVVVTSDHGEQFWEHDSWRHGSTLYDHQLLVPLIVHLPPQRLRALGGPRVVEEQVELIDVYPTVLDLLDLAAPAGLQGRSLLPLLEGRGPAEERFAFAEHTNVPRESKGLRTRRWKLILSYPRGREDRAAYEVELYDLLQDPAEQQNLAGERPDLVARLRTRLETLRRSGEAVPFEAEVPADIDPALRQELEALGYVGN